MKILREGQPFTGWAGESPFFLVITTEDGGHMVDVDEPGWMSEVPGLMRAPGEWLLVAKRVHDRPDGVPVLVMRVSEGEQPYYSRHTVGIAVGPGSGGEMVVYGIGKKRLDGHTDRMWTLPTGTVCAGDDVDKIVVDILQARASQQA